MNVKDYIFCKTCDEFVDFYHYNHNIEDAGHDKCKWRYVTPEELKGLVKSCKENGCEGMK